MSIIFIVTSENVCVKKEIILLFQLRGFDINQTLYIYTAVH